MGLFDFFIKKRNVKNNIKQLSKEMENRIKNTKFIYPYADSSTISLDEKEFYQPDEYYTLESYPGTMMAQKVVTFEERKKDTFPSKNGLYVPEILLLEYCNKGIYPKPSSGYPGFWWFEYGIRDIGHALESLEQRNFIKYGTKIELLSSLKVSELKEIATEFNIKSNQNKEHLIRNIRDNVEEIKLPDKFFSKKYTLTELGKRELIENEYVVYMHNHKQKTRDNVPEDLSFTVWDVNRLLANNDKLNWKKIVADLEEKRIGFRIADIEKEVSKNKADNEMNNTSKDIISYINDKTFEIKKEAMKSGDGLKEELEGIHYKKNGDDKKALYYFYIAIEKNFDAPALYIEAAKILRKYKLYDEELKIIKKGLINIGANNSHKKDLLERKEKVHKLISKNSN